MIIRSISGLRALAESHLTDSVIKSYASAFHSLTPEGVVYCGRDSRQSGDSILEVFFNELIRLGRDVIICGIVPTPTIQYMVEKTESVGGIIVTASHNPTQWNGLKFVNEKGTFFSEDQCANLFDLVDKDIKIDSAQQLGMYLTDQNAILKHVLSIVELSCIDIQSIRSRNFKIVVDAVNGAGSEALPLLLEHLGCETIKIHCDSSGIFSRGAEPLPKNLKKLSNKVLSTGSDLGFAVDPDSDRLALVNEKGEAIGEEYTLVIAALGYLSKKPIKQSFVTNLSTSLALEKMAERYNCSVIRTAIGEINVVNKMIEIDSHFGGEGNGGVILKESHLGRDALVGTALILNHLSAQEKTLGEIHGSLPQFFIEKDKIDAKGVDEDVLVKKVKKLFLDCSIDTNDGIKFIWNDSWLHMRKSNTEPIIRIYAESTTKEHAIKLIAIVKSVLADE